MEYWVKITQDVNLDLLKEKLLFSFKLSNMADHGVTQQQDGATSYSTKLVQTFCKEHFKTLV